MENKSLHNPSWRRLVAVLPSCVDSALHKAELGGDGALGLTFALSHPDERLQRFCELVPGKWRLPATYRIAPSTAIAEDLLLFLEWSQLKPERVWHLKMVSERFAVFARAFPQTQSQTGTPVASTESARDLVFAALAAQKLTGRELCQRAGITEMTLHNYKKTGQIRLENFLKITAALGVQLQWEAKRRMATRKVLP